MTFTADSNRKMVERLKAEKGYDENGKSLHHQKAGQSVANRATDGYFAKLKKTPEGRQKLREIGQKGAENSNRVQHGDKSTTN